jgi:hypothetical protein
MMVKFRLDTAMEFWTKIFQSTCGWKMKYYAAVAGASIMKVYDLVPINAEND